MTLQSPERRAQIATARQAVNEGRFDDARAICDAIFDTEPGHLAALQIYLSATRITPDDPVLHRLETFADASNIPNRALSQVHFMLGKALDDIGDYDRAFETFLMANRLKPVQFDAARKSNFADRLIDGVARAPRTVLPALPPRMVFILGMPRSGSTLLAQMMGAHPNITNLGEVEALAPALTFLRGQQVRLLDFVAGMDRTVLITARARYLQDIAPSARSSGNVLVDKMPENYWMAWAIPMLFPDAKIIHMRRDKRAVCWSCFRNDFGQGHDYSYEWASLDTQYDTHLKLTAAWKARDPAMWRDISLKDLTQAPKDTLALILADLGLPWDSACLTPARTGAAVKTLSKWKVRHSVDGALAESWRAYLPMMQAEWGVD